MSTQQARVDAIYRCIERADFDGVREYISDDVETTTPQGTLKGLHEWAQMGATFQAAAPDQHHQIVRSFENGDTVIVEGVYAGTHTGPLVTPDGAIPASGNSFALPYADFWTFADGKVVTHHVYWDNVTLMAQLGVMP
jgi:steroid delta-isomerase-like uncharacterized protein